mgnify:CR=1 FL=1
MSDEPRLARAGEHLEVETAWGRLVWHVSAAQGNSELLTTGLCFIDPGMANDRHLHPDCEEVLTVIRGRIVHSWNDRNVEMGEGDVIVIPPHVVHNARNIGDTIAELGIAFSSAYRTTVVVDGGDGSQA